MKNYRTHISFSEYLRFFPMRKIRLVIIASLLLTAGIFLLFVSRSMESMRKQQRIDSNKQKLPWDTLKYYQINKDRKPYHTQHKKQLRIIRAPNGVSKVREKARPLAPPVLVKPNSFVNFRQQILPPNFNSFKKRSGTDHQMKLQELHQFQKLENRQGIQILNKNIQKNPKTLVVNEKLPKDINNQIMFHASDSKMLANNRQMARFSNAKFSAQVAKMAFKPDNNAPSMGINLRYVPNPRPVALNANVLQAPDVRQHAMNGKFVHYSHSRFAGKRSDVAHIAQAPIANTAVLKANIGHASIGKARGLIIPNKRETNIAQSSNARKNNFGNVQNARISARKVVLYNLTKTFTVSASKSGITILKRERNSWINADSLCQNTSLKMETVAVPTPLGNVLIHGSNTEIFEYESAVENFEMRILSGYQKTILEHPNALVIDIGSGYGVYSIMAARMGHVVVAVEPNLSAIPGLCATVKLANYSNGVIITHLNYNSNMKSSKGEQSFEMCNSYLDLDALTEINSLHSHEDAVIRISPRINSAEEIILCLNKLIVLFNVKAVSMPWIKTSRRDAENILKLFGRMKMSPYEPDTPQDMLRSSDMSQWPSIVIWKSD